MINLKKAHLKFMIVTFMYSGITVGLQQTSYNTLETGGRLDVCAQMFVGNLEKNVSLSLTSTDGSAMGMLRLYQTI